jgi:UDPglucose--hexose-1-phosphate uridylyltransferase
MSELRWNPILEEWVVTATHRQDRTFLPPKDYCPLCPTKGDSFPTEVPVEDYEIVTFDNKFPSFQIPHPIPAIEGDDLYKVAPSAGKCEVVLYTSKHEGTLTDCTIEEIYKLILVWTDRFKDLSKDPKIKYVFIFENKGEVIGVTIPHPHGQIYAFPYIPPKIQREMDSCKKYYRKNKKCLMCTILDKEISFKKRIVCSNNHFVSMIPFFARYPYEIHIMSKRHLGTLVDMTNEEHWELAKILKEVLTRYDRLWNKSLPYMMVMHQAPCRGKGNHYHFHIEFYPPLRTPQKLKFLAGCESGAGTFINDTLPEEKAAELRELKIPT